MNQTKKRLSIINLAISITDIETIQLQILKLTLIKTDAKIQKILSVLQAENYAQAQALITAYIDSSTQEVLQRTSQRDSSIVSDSDQAIIDEFQLFVTTSTTQNVQTNNVELSFDDYTSQRPTFTKSKRPVDFDSLLNLEADDILPENIDIKKTSISDSFFEPSEEKKDGEISINNIPKDTFFDTQTTNNETENKEERSKKETEENMQEETIEETNNSNEEIIEQQDIVDAPIVDTEARKVETITSYKPMPHIAQKLISMKKQYPPIQKTYEKFDTVESFLTKISNEGYSESEIEEMLELIKKLTKESKYTEASQLLLICGATESKFAQFMFARELYRGTLLVKNVSEAFKLMNALTIDDYPEALCDLGQFYEYGIGTTPDSRKAESLYKEAVNLNIQRAKKHYENLKKKNRGFFK